MAPTVSLCMIVKDEESQLPRCLASAREFVDEMIVVDTGSSDATVAIAESFGAVVKHHAWDGSFSTARNVSLEHATGEWILILDADECLARAEGLRDALAAAGEGVEAFVVPLINFVGERAQEEAVTAPSVRVFRNRPEYRFSRALHEQIMKAIQQARPDSVVGALDIAIEHYGYLNAIVADKDKIARNLALAQEEVKRYPEDAFSWYNLGQEHFRLCEWDKAIDAYRRAFPYLESLAAGFAPALVKHLCVCLLNSQRPEEVMRVSEDAQEAYPEFTDLWVLQGLALMQQADFAGAAERFRTALAKGEVGAGFYISDEGVGSYKSHWWLAACCLQLGRLDEAEAEYLASLAAMAERGRFLAAPLQGLMQIAELRQVPAEQTLATLAGAVDLSHPRWRDVTARLLLSHGRREAAERLLQDADQIAPATWLVRGAVHFGAGELDQAVACWEHVPADCPEAVQADWHRLLGRAAGGDLDGAQALLEGAIAGRGESELVNFYRSLLPLWRGEPVPPPAGLRGHDALRGHLIEVMALLLKAEAFELFERSIGALSWTRLPEAEQAALLGTLYHHAGLADMAFEALVLALESGDRRPETLKLLGLMCLKRGAYAEAESILRECLRLQRDLPGVWSRRNPALLGFLAALSAQGKQAEAEPLWDDLLAREAAEVTRLGQALAPEARCA